MDKLFSANVSGTPPTMGATNGYPTDGDPATATPATIPGAGWFWMITAELLNLVTGAGILANGAALNQVFTAVTTIATTIATTAANTAAAAAVITATNTVLGWFTGTHQDLTAAKGFQDLPGGRTHQWVEQFQSAVGSSDVVIAYRKAFTGTAPIPQISVLDVSMAGGSSNFLGWAVTARSLTGCTVSFGPNGGAGRDITVRADAFGNT